jgi:hypothetical protein
MSKLALNRWAFLSGCVLAGTAVLGACGGSHKERSDESDAGDDNAGGDAGSGGSTEATGGRSVGSGGKGSGGASGTSGRAGAGSSSAGEAGDGEGGGGGVEPPETCSTNEECAPAGLVCDPVPAKCVECFFDTDCAAGRLCVDAVCAGKVGCEDSLDCPSVSESVCDASKGYCVACASALDCPEDNDCVNSACVPYQSCNNSLDCTSPEVCDTAAGRCYRCVRDADCDSDERCVDHTCRTACQSDNTCTPQGLLCDLGRGHCVSCLTDGDCPDIYHCAAGACVRDTCVAGSKKCEGNVSATCSPSGDGYDHTICGTRQTCVDDGPDTACVDWVCTAGERECDAAARALVNCSADGLVADVEEDCSAQGLVCYEESCQDLECVPSAFYCEGETVRLCAADGLSSTLHQTCSSGQFCSDELGACTTRVCEPDEPYCNGTRAQVCNARGSGPTGDPGTDCRASVGLQCVDGACACLSTYADCDGDAGNGCEAATSSDPGHCGACGNECSDNHVAAPRCASSVCNSACEAGYTDCNSDKASDGCETNIATDAAHCGACDSACSANHVDSPRCASGICNGACADGYVDCNANKQTDGCETAVSIDPDHCGGCTTACSSAGMATRTCDGTCNGTCNADYLDCNDDKQSDGCEVDRRFDEKHCGDCETVCSDGESCIAGECGPCNNSVLLLSDGVLDGNEAMATALEAAGLDVTRIDSGITSYAGTPAASNFGAVLMPVGNLYSGATPTAGENSILAAAATGTGVLMTGWAGYRFANDQFSPAFETALAITGYTQTGTSVATSYTLAVASHPIWAGLFPTFNVATGQLVEVGPVLVDKGATLIATCAGCQAPYSGVVVKDANGSNGRIVMLAHTANYGGSTWYEDTNMMRMFTNAAKWATRCE